jgi:hypothetical protein
VIERRTLFSKLGAGSVRTQWPISGTPLMTNSQKLGQETDITIQLAFPSFEMHHWLKGLVGFLTRALHHQQYANDVFDLSFSR